jgi:hypothetical protein
VVLHGKKLEDHREEALESSFAEDRGLLQAPVLLLLTLIHERPRRLIHRSTWKRNSANFAVTEFYEVRGFLGDVVHLVLIHTYTSLTQE